MSTRHRRNPAGRVSHHSTDRRLRRSTLALGIAIMLSAGANANAQESAAPDRKDATELETVVVTGVRGAVLRAQEIKQEASQIIDSVTAEDIGALPDRSVTETLKRVSGVTVTNFLARDDPDHFSAEGSGVMIRGLTQVRGELNGRDIFSANGGRGLSFEEVPSELMAGVDVYKNPSAEIIEGGLGGTVNLRTRMPFDEAGRKIAASLDYNYGDFVKEGRPSGSFLFSDRWQTGVGEIGFLANLSYSELATRSDGIQVAPYARRGVHPENDGNWVMRPDGSWIGPDDLIDMVRGDSGHDVVFVPGGVNWRTLDFERKRQGLALAFQWRPNEDTEVYSQFLRSDYSMQWRERAMFLADEFDMENGDGKSNRHLPAPGTQWTFDSNGVFQKGYLTGLRTEIDWTADPAQLCCGLPPYGIGFNTNNRLAKQETSTTDWSIGFRHFITEKLVARGDFQYVKSSSTPTDFSVFTNIFLDQVYLDLTGKYPTVGLGDNPAQLQDPANYYWRAAMDHIEDNSGDARAGRVDFEYTFDDSSWLRFARFGARVANRGQVNYSSNWNWAVISDTWATLDPDFGSWAGGNELAWLDRHLTQYSELYSLGNFFRGKVDVPTDLWYPNDQIVDIEKAAEEFRKVYAERGWGWEPTAFQTQDRNVQDEQTQAAYGVLYFENSASDSGLQVDGNLGVRVVKTSVSSVGYGRMFDITSTGSADLVTQEVMGKFNGSYFGISNRSSFTDVLPSLNVRVRFTDELQWRFAASKAISRPDFRQMQSWLPLTVSLHPDCGNPIDPTDPDSTIWICGFEGLTGFEGVGGNPELEPMRANQFDTALEWYFGPTNMLYATVFHKDVKGYFATQTRPEEIFGDIYQITRPHNLERGRISGFEIGYNQFFDFLPGWWSGFGVQANYTYVDSSGGSNTIPDPNEPDARVALVDLPLEGLSRDSYNVVGIYEKGPWSIRLAYNWRSRYLLTSSDVSTRLPTWADDYGQLDGSFFYNINNNIQIGIQANNLTDSITTVLMGPHYYPSDGYKDETLRVRGYFMNDRRYSAVLRARW